MKTIGIKLADGTFYPILEEGSPKKRMLDLTTAKDNQTKVQIDLYRSETGSMDDAEYVDTLEVTKLNPHPNGEPELHLSVGLDEENRLTAEVVDPETGKKSETEVTLVSRTLAERSEPVDFAVNDSFSAESSDTEPFSFDAPDDTAASTEEEATFTPDELPEINSEVLEDMPFSFDHTDGIAAAGAVASTNDFSNYAESSDELPVTDTTLESVDFSKADDLDDSFDDTVPVDFGNSVNLTDGDTTESNETVSDSSDATVADTDTSSDDFNLPDFDESNVTIADDFSADSVPDEVFDSNSVSDGDATVQEEKFDMPDFGDIPDFDDNSDSTIEQGTFGGEASASGLNFDDLNDPIFDTPDFDDTPSDSTKDAFASFDSLDTTSGNTGSAMDFSDLYDKETIAGEHASIYDDEEVHKKTRIPVIICIICAIICVIATVLILFIVPSKYNLIRSRNTKTVTENDVAVVETVKEEPAEEKRVVINVTPAPEPEPAPVAVEDKIVVAEKPSKVVPAPAPKKEKKPDAKYHIRWGDTLWDISDSYYKTPWKYKKIASYNKIRNPDLIISGTDILIPAE